MLDVEKGGLLTQLSHTWHHQRKDAKAVSVDTLVDPSKRRVAGELVALVENSSAVHRVHCLARPEGSPLRVGPDDFRDVASDRCQVFSAASTGPQAHALWEVVDLGNGAVGLRALSNGKFLKVVPPRAEDWNAPWKVEVVALLPEHDRRIPMFGADSKY